MSSIPKMRSSRGPDDSAAPGRKKRSPSEHLASLSDYQLQAYHASALKFSTDPSHPKHLKAARLLPLIEGEMKRRAEPASSDALRTGQSNE